jgi:hypothetical protein
LSFNRLSTESPVLIVGPPRSGSTWVEQVLGLTRGAYAIHEPDNEASDPFAFRAKLALGRYPVLGPDDEAPPGYLDLWAHALTGQVHWANPRWLAAKALLKQSRPAVKASFSARRPTSSTLRMAGALAAPPSHRRKAQQIIVKSVHAPLAVEWIARQGPLKVVVIQRNPYNVVASYTQLGWSDSGLDTHPVLRNQRAGYSWVPSLEPGASSLARVAWQIGLFTSALDVAAGRNPDWHVVSHEELCRDPESGFRALCTDLGLPWTQAASDFIAASNRPGQGLVTNRVAAEQPERWRSRLTPEQAEEIADVLVRFPVPTRTSAVRA